MSQAGQKTGRERVMAAYKGEFADCVPAYPIAGSFAGCLDGLSIEEYCTNPTKAVKAMINYYERYQPDIMVAFNDLAKEVEAVGCHVKYSDYVVPSIDEHVLQDDKGLLARLEVPDPFRAGRIPGFLEQCEALSAQKFPSGLGAVLVGPWTIAMLMRNPELHVPGHAGRPGVRARPDALRHRVRQAGRRRGADHEDRPVVLGPHRLLLAGGARHLPRVHQAVPPGPRESLQGQEGRHHACTSAARRTRSTRTWSTSASSPSRSISISSPIPRCRWTSSDRLVTLGNQRGVVGIGNVDVTIFERATKGEIEAEVRRCLDTVGKRSRFVLSTSCELPPRANPDCVKWFMEAAREYGRVERILGA